MPDRMPAIAFRLMSATLALKDLFFPAIDQRVARFGIREGMTVIDYGCGPGRYTVRFSSLVGDRGKVYAVDIHELAIQAVKQKMEQRQLRNITPVLAKEYDSGLPDHTADITCAIDMFFGVAQPSTFLGELHRITKHEGLLVIDDGHQSRHTTLQKIG